MKIKQQVLGRGLDALLGEIEKAYDNEVIHQDTLRLLQLTKNIQKALLDKKITVEHAKVMIGLTEKEQQRVLNSTIGQKLSVRDVEFLVKDISNKREEKKTSSIDDYDLIAIKNQFKLLGYLVKLSDNKLIIEFDNKEQIEHLLKKIS